MLLSILMVTIINVGGAVESELAGLKHMSEIYILNDLLYVFVMIFGRQVHFHLLTNFLFL